MASIIFRKKASIDFHFFRFSNLRFFNNREVNFRVAYFTCNDISDPFQQTVVRDAQIRSRLPCMYLSAHCTVQMHTSLPSSPNARPPSASAAQLAESESRNSRRALAGPGQGGDVTRRSANRNATVTYTCTLYSRRKTRKRRVRHTCYVHIRYMTTM